MMQAGGKMQLWMHPDLGYGPQPRHINVPPNSLLVYELELLEVKERDPNEPVTGEIIRVPSAEELKKGARIEAIEPPVEPQKK
jgi:hypothetical protein